VLCGLGATLTAILRSGLRRQGTATGAAIEVATLGANANQMRCNMFSRQARAEKL